MSEFIYIIEGHHTTHSKKKIVTLAYNKKKFEWIIKTYLPKFECGMTFEIWEHGSLIYKRQFKNQEDVVFEEWD